MEADVLFNQVIESTDKIKSKCSEKSQVLWAQYPGIQEEGSTISTEHPLFFLRFLRSCGSAVKHPSTTGQPLSFLCASNFCFFYVPSSSSKYVKSHFYNHLSEQSTSVSFYSLLFLSPFPFIPFNGFLTTKFTSSCFHSLFLRMPPGCSKHVLLSRARDFGLNIVSCADLG